MHLSEILNHLGEDRSKYYDAVAPPIIASSNFVFNNLADFRQKMSNEQQNYVYTRGNNPTVRILCEKIAALEKAEDALVVSSGSTAIAAAIMSQVNQGDHVICVDHPYSWTRILLTDYLSRFGVTHTFVNGSSIKEIELAIRPDTKVLFLESPNSLMFDIQDLKACAALAKKHNLVTIIDNSYASPLFQNPISMGIDLVVHSATKYLNGHSDVVCGVIAGSKTLIQKIFQREYMTLGLIIGPFEAQQVIRGLRTLELRMHRSNESAYWLAERLEKHPLVERVLHPFLPSFPQQGLAKAQMTGCGGLFSVFFSIGDKAKMEAFIHKLQHFTMAVSWGGHESLMMPSIAFYDIPGRKDTPIPWNVVRFYIGLEDPAWLLGDIENALAQL